MKIHGEPHAVDTRKILLALAEKGSCATLIPLDLATGEHTRPAHLALQPYGEVPVLRDDEFVLYDAQAILRYVDATLPGVSLVPHDPRQRARMDQWLGVESSHVRGPLRTLEAELRISANFGQRPDGTRVERSRRALGHTLSLLDRALQAAPYLAGTSISLADLTFIPCLQLLLELGQHDLLDPRASLAGWWLRMRTRESFRQVLADEPTEIGSTPARCHLVQPQAALH